jgi:hypothetical protein
MVGAAGSNQTPKVSTSKLVFNASTGNLGIGTTSPQSKLHVVGNAIIGQNATNTNEARLDITSGGSAYDSVIDLGYWAGFDAGIWFVKRHGADGSFRIANASTGSEVPVLTINTSNNVGIGTSSPTSGDKVEIVGALRVHTGNDWDAIRLSTDGANGYIQGLGDETGLRIRSEYGNVLLADNRGNVGVGTDGPTSKLSVNGVTSVGLGSKLSFIGLDINSGGTPNFIKIVTTIPFASGGADFTINIKGFQYSGAAIADLSISWHYYLSTFYSANVKSSGSWAPTVRLSAEGGFVAIVLSSPGYWPKLYVESMYSSNYNDDYASGWSWVDADATGSPIVTLAYKSDFGNNFMMTSSGNVGIGTNNPGAKLTISGQISRHVVNASNGTSGFELADAPSGGNSIGAITRRDNGIGIASYDYISFLTGSTSGIGSGSEQMRLTSTGLGIGTNNPNQKLGVNGNAIFSGGAGGSPYIAFSQDQAGTTPSYWQWASTTGITTFYTTNASASGGSFNWWTAGLNRMVLDSSGNLGLGVTPSAWGNAYKVLQVSSGASYAGSVNGAFWFSNAYNDNTDWRYVTSTNASGYTQFGGVHSWFTAPSGTAGNPISFTQAMTLDASGNLLVGTTSTPTTSGGSMVVNNSLYVGAASQNINYGNGISIGNAGKALLLQQTVNTNDERVYLTNNAQTSTASGGFTGAFAYNKTGANASAYYQVAGQHIWLTAPSGTAGNAISFTQAMTLDASGNLGLGTTSPKANAGYATFTLNNATNGGVVQFTQADTTIGQLFFDSNGGTLRSVSNTALLFGTNNTERARITAAGNVGIGTTNPGYKLEVNGSFAATTKSFVIDHPTKENHKLRYGSLEGPENGIYVRGRLKGKNVIELPEYWTKLVDPDSIAVQLTAIGKGQQLYVEDIRDNVVFVASDDCAAADINCFYVVFAERVDVEKLEVEVACQ